MTHQTEPAVQLTDNRLRYQTPDVTLSKAPPIFTRCITRRASGRPLSLPFSFVPLSSADTFLPLTESVSIQTANLKEAAA